MLRLPEDVWRKGTNGVIIPDDPHQAPTTGDPVVDEWERKLAAGEMDEDDDE